MMILGLLWLLFVYLLVPRCSHVSMSLHWVNLTRLGACPSRVSPLPDNYASYMSSSWTCLYASIGDKKNVARAYKNHFFGHGTGEYGFIGRAMLVRAILAERVCRVWSHGSG